MVIRPSRLCRLDLPTAISTCPLAFRPAPWYFDLPLGISSCLLVISSDSEKSRPSWQEISPFPRCHLDRKGEISSRPGSNPQQEKTDFSLRFEMTEGMLSRPSPYREQRDFSLAIEMTRKMLEMTVVGIATLPRCHLDQRERSHAAIIRPKKGSLGNTRFFLASLRNDSGGGIMAFALPGTTRFLASARNDREKKRNDSGGFITAFALPGRSR